MSLKHGKKVLSLFLSVLLILSTLLISVPTMAADGDTNIALTGTATESSFSAAGREGATAIDGITGSNGWKSGVTLTTAPQWLMIDLGSVKTIHQFVIYHNSTGFELKDFKIQGSDNGTDFTDIITITGNTQIMTTHVLADYGFTEGVQYRYIRLYVTAAGPAAGDNARCDEFQIWGYPASTAPTPTPTPTPTPESTPVPDTNLALNGTATESSYSSGSRTGAFTIDGNTGSSSGWKSGIPVTTAPQWIKVDLGSIKTVNKFVIYHNPDPGYTLKDFKIQGSNVDSDIDSDFTDLVTVTDNLDDAFITAHDVFGVQYRYFRLYVTAVNAAAGGYARCEEFQIWGNSAVNILTNPGFESGTLDGWDQAGVGYGTYAISTTEAHSGSYCGMVDPAAAGRDCQLVQRVTVKPSTTYRLTAYCKVAVAGEVAEIGVEKCGDYKIQTTDKTSYSQLSVTFTTGVYNTTADINMYKGSGGAAYADDFVLTEQAAAEPTPTPTPPGPTPVPKTYGYNVYYGLLHNHSNISDGSGTPAQAYSYARDYGQLDFFSLADHSSYPDDMTSEEYDQIKAAADANNQDGVFTTFWGFEWTTDNLGHIAVINSPDYCSSSQSATDSIAEIMSWISARDCAAFFNHPGDYDSTHQEFSHFAATPIDQVVGMELFNKTLGFNQYYYNNGFVDTVNNPDHKNYYNEALSSEWDIGAAGSDDNHDATWGTRTGYRLAVLANANTRADIYAALKARRFYSTLDKNISLSFKVNGKEMGSEIVPGTYDAVINVSDADVETFTKVQLFKNGTVVNTWDLNPGTTDPCITQSITTAIGDYYYVKVTETDTDEAISSPVFIKSSYIDVTSFGAVPNDAVDDTAAIQSAVDAVSSGGTVYIPDGTYNISDVIHLKSGVTLEGQSQSGAVLKFTGQEIRDAVISIEGESNVDVTKLTIDGDNTQQLDVGIKAENSSNIKVTFVTVKDISYYPDQWGPHAIYFRGGDEYTTPGVTNSEISDCTITNIGVGFEWGAGIRISWGSSNNKVLRNNISETGRGGILCDNGSTDLLISDNTVTGSGRGRTGDNVDSLGIEIWQGCDRAVIEDNKIDHWLSVDGSKLVAVRRNTVSTTDGTLQWCGLEDASETSDNVFTDNNIGAGSIIGISVSNDEVKERLYFGHNTVQDSIQWGAQIQGDLNYAKYLYFYKCDFSNTTDNNPNAPYPGDAGNGFRINGNTDYLTFDNCKSNNNAGAGIQICDENVDHLTFKNSEIRKNSGNAFTSYSGYSALDIKNMTINGNKSNKTPAVKSFNNLEPVAIINGPSTGCAGEALSFSSGSIDPDGSIAHVLWDFNDGSPSNSESQIHTFDSAGTYRITLIVWDDSGRGAMVEKFVTIKPLEYIIANSDLTNSSIGYVTTITVDRNGAPVLSQPKLLVVGTIRGNGQACWTIPIADKNTVDIAVNDAFINIKVYLMDGDINWDDTTFSDAKSNVLSLDMPKRNENHGKRPQDSH